MKQTAAAIVIALWSAPLAAQENERRDLDAHEHGRGSLNIAVEGDTIWMELEAPGADIVGFEYVAESAEDRQAVEAAKTVLVQPLALFAIPSGADCRLSDASVSLIGGEHEDEHEHEADHEDEHEGETNTGEHEDEHAADHEDEHEGEHEDEHAAEHEDEHGEERHNEFHAEYVLKCAAPGEIDSIAFPYFDAFPGAHALTVNVATANAQTTFEVDRDSPRLDVAGLF